MVVNGIFAAKSYSQLGKNNASSENLKFRNTELL